MSWRRWLWVAVGLGLVIQAVAIALLATHGFRAPNAGFYVGLGGFSAAISIGGAIGGEGRALAGAVFGSATAIVTGLLAIFGG